MQKITIHTIHHLFALITLLRKAGQHRMLFAPLILLLPLSLGWPLVVWLAGGRGSAAASCLLIAAWRAVTYATTGHQCPPVAARPSVFL
ncbi:MAG TPA: hypothetical protein VJ805_04190 [Nitrospiraceae bacterium]|nr:hypothetical protein [Nitrospiraceae bacterium]